MRITNLFFLLISFISVHAKQPGKLDGKWIPVKQELEGSMMPEAAMKGEFLIIADSTYTFTAESVDKGVLTYDDQHMDIYGREGANSGKHFMAIYKYDNGELTICYSLADSKYPKDFITKGKKAYFMCVFKQAK